MANPSLRLATTDDIPEALQLCRISGWNQREKDWKRLLQYEPRGCFAAEMDGRLVGTVTTTCYGTSLAWIGMMLVHPDFRRRGIATLLMERSLEYLQGRNIGCIKLDATPDGQHVYQRLGFSSEWSMQRWLRPELVPIRAERTEGPSQQPDAMALRRYFELDRQAFGVDRGEWLLKLLPDSEVRCRPAAMGMLRRGFLASYLGPLVASELADARFVVQDLIKTTSQPIFWDIPDPNHEAVELASGLQFKPVRQLTRMWLGRNLIESDLRQLFALADPSTG